MATAADLRGVLTTLNHALPVGLDGGRLAIWRLREGRTYADVRNDIANALDGVNEEVLTAWSDVVTITPNDFFEYPNGGSVLAMDILSDLSRPESVKGKIAGHMIDLTRKGRSIGGSEIYFRDARESTILAALRDLVQAGRDRLEQDILTRAMSTTENLLNVSGYDVPFVNGNPTNGGPLYVPPKWNGKVFDEHHTHYLGFDSAASPAKTFDDVLTGLAQTLNEHGHNAPYVCYIAEADVPTYRTLQFYIKPLNQQIMLVDRGGLTSGNTFFEQGELEAMPAVGGRYIGAYDSAYGEVKLRATARIPTGYAFMYKSYGTNDPRNPIAVRIHPDVGFGFRIKEVPSFDTTWPVKQIDVEIEYGVSCGNNRTIGAAGYLVSGGVYVNPTIS